MSAGAAAYPGSVETMQIVGDVQQQKSLQQVQITQQQLLQQSANPPTGAAVQLVDGTTLVPTESLISPQQQQQQPQILHHLQAATHRPQMATIVTAAGATPILVPSSQPVGPIAVAIGPTGAQTLVSNTGQVLDYSQMNGGGSIVQAELSAGGAESGGAVAAAVVPEEYYIQAATGPDVMHSVVSPEQMMGGVASVAGGVVASTSDGTPIPFDQLKQLLQTQLEYYFSR